MISNNEKNPYKYVLTNLALPPDPTTPHLSQGCTYYEWRKQFGTKPITIQCRFCQKHVRTVIKSQPGPLGNS